MHEAHSTWAIFAYALFMVALIISAYMFWSHNQYYASREEENDEL